MGVLDKLKKFINEKDTEKKFKKAGVGHRLDQPSSSAAAFAPKTSHRWLGKGKKDQSHQDSQESEHSFTKLVMRMIAGQCSDSRRLCTLVEEPDDHDETDAVRAQQRQQQQQPQRSQQPKISNEERMRRADALAAAAQARAAGSQAPVNRSKASIQAEARRQLAEQSQLESSSSSQTAGQELEQRELEAAPVLAVTGVFYYCPMIDEDTVLPKDQLIAYVRSYLDQLHEEDALTASILMVHSLNKPTNKQTAIDTIGKYIDNVLNNPTEQKFRKIRVANKAFQDRVLQVAGAKEFLLAVGFVEKMESTSDGTLETHLVLPEEADFGVLKDMRDGLVNGETIPIKLAPNPTVLGARSLAAQTMRVPDEFFDLTPEEIKREQQSLEKRTDQMLSLRTREMRERDQMLSKSRYKYTLVRVKFPDELILQGTFRTRDAFSQVREFVQSHLEHSDLPLFQLRLGTGDVIAEDSHDSTLGELGLAPAVVLHFQWSADVRANWQQANQSVMYLSADTVQRYLAN